MRRTRTTRDDSVELDAENETEAAAAYFVELWDDSGVDASERAPRSSAPSGTSSRSTT
jgi:hypothetical protein